ncbi:unnamed protein product [Pleuronectes platessa]|uniref:Uncharacterized protein n=1 Tax=Pleuronectes platessa TaxID=8262 RepID=A0A9N7VKC1_PLEPL|nr:unnamed protein product [Pleuronectes platessa]
MVFSIHYNVKEDSVFPVEDCVGGGSRRWIPQTGPSTPGFLTKSHLDLSSHSRQSTTEHLTTPPPRRVAMKASVSWSIGSVRNEHRVKRWTRNWREQPQSVGDVRRVTHRCRDDRPQHCLTGVKPHVTSALPPSPEEEHDGA